MTTSSQGPKSSAEHQAAFAAKVEQWGATVLETPSRETNTVVQETIVQSQESLPMGQSTMMGRTTVLPEVAMNAGAVVLRPKNKGRYDNIKHLGAGGAGEVVLVQDNDIQRKVAMKRVHQSYFDEIKLARFVEEIKTVGQLEHPNIIPIHDVGLDDDGQLYFTMKFVQGETLGDIITKLRNGNPHYHAVYTYERRTQIFVEILQAIHFAHARGIIHRDIKPDNVMVGEYGEVIVMDWGIAKQIRPNPFLEEEKNSPQFLRSQELLEELEAHIKATGHEPPEGTPQRVFQTQMGAVIGTPAYMSPEQVTGKADERSDIYSLCMMFFEFLNLHHPLRGKSSVTEVLFGVLDEPVPDSESLSNPHQGPVPRELCFFLRKGLRKNADERFQNVKVMIDELQANLEGRICVYCPSTFLKRGSFMMGHFMDNHRFQGPIYFVVLLCIFGIGVWQTVRMFAGFF